jgi:U3 small nucleolar RNA-associated protein 20
LKHFAQRSFATLPLSSPHGLMLDETRLCSLASRNLRLLRIGISKQFASEIADNLTLLGACFAASGLKWSRHEVANNTLNNDKPDDESEHDDEQSDLHTVSTDSALEHLFQALSGILRREPKRTRDDGEMLFRRAESLIPRHTALNTLAKLVEALPPESFSPILDNMLLPLIHLTDSAASAPFSSDSAFSKAHQELVNSASELMDHLQKILETTEYVKVLQRVKRDVQLRREDRRMKRKVEAVAMPERAERLKKKKRASEKLRKKEKGLVAKGMRRGW